MATTRDGVRVLVAQTNQDILSENLIVREELPLWKPVFIGVITLLFLTITAYAVSITRINAVYAQDIVKTATQSIYNATKIAASWTKTPTLTMTPTATATPTLTNTPLPTSTTQPKRRVVVISTVAPDEKAEMSVTLPTSTFYTGGILAPDVNIRPGRVVNIKPIAPISRSETISNVQYITVTATPEYWEAWHTVDIAVRNAPERDGSSIVCHYVISGLGFTRDVKMKMANHEHDFRVGERESQQVRSDGGYCFYISQGQTMWDCSIYPGNSAVLPLLVGSNQEIAVTWEYGQTELIRSPAPQSTGPGVDNGRSPPQNDPAPQPTAPPATNTPAPSATSAATWTPHIVYVVVTSTPEYRTATPQPTAPPAFTPTGIVFPPTFTPPANFNTPPPPLNPVSDSVTINAARYKVYLPVLLKEI